MTAISPEYFVVDYLLGLSSSILDPIVDTDTTFGRMIFRSALPVSITKTGKRAITVTNGTGTMPLGPSGGLASMPHVYGNSVQVRLYADHTRTIEGDVTVEDGIDRAWAMFGLFDTLLSAGDLAVPLRPGIPVVQSNRSSPPFEGYDQQIDCPYIAVSYDLAVLANP